MQLNRIEEINENLRIECIEPLEYEEFVDMKLKEMEHHVIYAEKLGIEDIYCSSYTEEQALKSLNKHKTYMLKSSENKIFGFVQLSDFTGINTGSGVYVNNLYIKENYRKMGIATSVLNYLANKFNEVIFEAYYNIPGNKLYKDLGFVEIGKIYLKTNNS